MKKAIFIKNAAILTVSSLLLRAIGVFFKIWLAARIGAAGIGLYQLIFSFYVFLATFAATGLCTAVTRMVADEAALGTKRGVVHILRRSITLTLLIALSLTATVFFGARFWAKTVLGDLRTATALRILSFTFPFIGTLSCLRGYFLARRNAVPNAATQIAEQLIRIALTVFLVSRFAGSRPDILCGAIFFGDVVASAVSVGILALCTKKDLRRLNGLSGRAAPPFGVVRRLCQIALPMTAGKYLAGGLRTAENLSVPRLLAHGNGKDRALAQFGWVKGMALPVLLFPSVLLNTLSTLLIPEISEAAARGRRAILRETVRRVLRLTLLVSLLFALLFWLIGRALGEWLYHRAAVGELLCALAPLVPFMYLDSVSDGILKGLDQQNFCFRVGLADAGLRLALIFPVLPRFGLPGFLAVMYLSNFYTALRNLFRVLRLCEIRPNWAKSVLLPLAAAGFSAALCRRLTAFFTLSPPAFVLLCGGLAAGCYILLLFGFRCCKKEDFSFR